MPLVGVAASLAGLLAGALEVAAPAAPAPLELLELPEEPQPPAISASSTAASVIAAAAGLRRLGISFGVLAPRAWRIRSNCMVPLPAPCAGSIPVVAATFLDHKDAGGPRSFPAATSGEERDRLFARQAELYPQFNEYAQRTARLIPVIAPLPSS
jgi:hypothetical protein